MQTGSADYHMLINEWAWSRSQVCLLRLEVDLGSVLESARAWTEMETQCIKGIYRLKLISSENNSVFKGLKQQLEGWAMMFLPQNRKMP